MAHERAELLADLGRLREEIARLEERLGIANTPPRPDELFVQRKAAPTDDVADRTRAELNRMTATLIAGLAHEINNPLGIVFVALEALERGHRHALEPLKDAIYRIADLVRGVSLLVVESEGQGSSIDVRRTIEQAVRCFAYEPRQIDLDCDAIFMEADRVRFHQLVHTLLLVYLHGSRDAIALSCRAAGERLTLEIRGVVPQSPDALHVDMGAVLRGETPPPSVPLRIAERLATDLGGTWSAERRAESLNVRISLPGAQESPPILRRAGGGQSGRPTSS